MHKSAGATFGHIFQYAHILRAKMPCSEAKDKHAEYHVCFRIDKINDNP